MSRSKPLHISIPKPCNENWDLMTTNNEGHFCNNCQKTVIDFSYFSNAELYNYLKDLKTIPCGRFHTNQLNTPINAGIQKKNFWINIYRPIAATLALFAIKNSAAANSKKEIPTTLSPSWKNSVTKDSTDEKIIISGVVKDMFQKPIEHAEVSIENTIVARTDKYGNYQFELKEKQSKSLMLIISYPDLVTAVRNYHPAMLSTTFDVILYQESTGEFYTMGWMSLTTDNLPVKSICFKKNIITLDSKTKDSLSSLATFMRNNPSYPVNIKGYPPLIKLNKSRQELVRNYLINTEGISADRIILSMETSNNKEKSNTLDIIINEQ